MSTHDPEITQWEGIGPNGRPYEGDYTSMAHGWASGIVPALTNYILGVVPSGPGFSVYTIKPIPGDVEWAKGVVPTPNGPITVNWQQNQALGLFYLTATAPAGSQGRSMCQSQTRVLLCTLTRNLFRILYKRGVATGERMEAM